MAGVWTGPTGAQVAQMVASQVNWSGGVAERRFDVRVVSQAAVVQGELTPAGLHASLDSMANDPRVLAVVTRVTDGTSERATRLFEQAGLPYLVASPVPRDYAQTHPHGFMLVPSMEDQAEFMAEQAMSLPAPRRAAIINVRDLFTDSLAKHLEGELKRRGVEVVHRASFLQTADQNNLVAKAAETATYKPNVLLWIGRSPSLMVMHGTLLNQIPDLRIISNDLVESFHLYQNARNVYTGVRFLRYMNPAAQDSVVRSVRDRLIMWIGRDELNNEAAITYDALHGIVQALKSGVTTRQQMYEYLKKNPTFDGITGKLAFGQGQRLHRPMHWAEVGMDSTKTIALSR